MSGKVPTKVFVGNLSDTCAKINLQRLFETYGSVVECDIIKNYGFVHFAESADAQLAVQNLDGMEFEGTTMKVELSHSKVRQKPGMGGKLGCYRCGREGHWSKDCPKGPSRPNRPRREDPYEYRDPYRDPYYRDPYSDPYYRDRYPPPPPDRYRPYADPYDRHPLPPPPPPRDPYYRLRDPYARPPPEYYGRRVHPPPPRYSDPYFDYYDRESAYPVPSAPKPRVSPAVTRVPAPY